MIPATITCVSTRGASVRAELDAFLTRELRDLARADAEHWIKSLRAVPYDGRTMRERFTYRGDSLWWFTELYLQRMRRLETATATLIALNAARDQHGPASLVIETDDLVVRDVAHTFGRTRDLPVETRGRPIERLRHARPSYLAGLTATLSPLRPTTTIEQPGKSAVAVFVHTALAPPRGASGRPSRSYLRQLVETLGERVGRDNVRCITFGRRGYRQRFLDRAASPTTPPRWPRATPIERFAPEGALTGALDLWRRRSLLAHEIVTGKGVRAAGRVRQDDLWPVLRRELEAVALLQWPWAARAMDEAAAALFAITPEVVVVTADATARGRAIVLEARRRRVPTVGVQHELLTDFDAAYAHEPDELQPMDGDRGFPLADRLLVFDQTAARRLDEVGHVPAPRITVTGHPRMDALRVAQLTRMDDRDREAFRRQLGVHPAQRLAVLVARIEALGPMLPAILSTAAARTDVFVAIKTHPSDLPDGFGTLAEAQAHLAVVPDSVDLARLLAAADGVITHESMVAVDALSIGIPTLVVGPPEHTAPLVDAGIMLNATSAQAIPGALNSLLRDEAFRRRLARIVSGSASETAVRGAARTVDRAVDAILSTKTAE